MVGHANVGDVGRLGMPDEEVNRKVWDFCEGGTFVVLAGVIFRGLGGDGLVSQKARESHLWGHQI